MHSRIPEQLARPGGEAEVSAAVLPDEQMLFSFQFRSIFAARLWLLLDRKLPHMQAPLQGGRHKQGAPGRRFQVRVPTGRAENSCHIAKFLN